MTAMQKEHSKESDGLKRQLVAAQREMRQVEGDVGIAEHVAWRASAGRKGRAVRCIKVELVSTL